MNNQQVPQIIEVPQIINVDDDDDEDVRNILRRVSNLPKANFGTINNEQPETKKTPLTLSLGSLGFKLNTSKFTSLPVNNYTEEIKSNSEYTPKVSLVVKKPYENHIRKYIFSDTQEKQFRQIQNPKPNKMFQNTEDDDGFGDDGTRVDVVNTENKTKRERENKIIEREALEAARDFMGVKQKTEEEPTPAISIELQVKLILAELFSQNLSTEKLLNPEFCKFSTFVSRLIPLMKIINPIDNGILLIKFIFGILITHQKVTGRIGETMRTSFPNIIKLISELDISSLEDSNDYKSVSKIVKFFSLNSTEDYRKNVSGTEQINNVIKLLTEMKKQKVKVHFPVTYKIEVQNASITLRGTPTLEDLQKFFEEKKAVAVKTVVKPKQREIRSDDEDEDKDDKPKGKGKGKAKAKKVDDGYDESYDKLYG